MERFDIHRPSAIVPDDYVFIAFDHIKIGCGTLHDRDDNASRNLVNPVPRAMREYTPREIVALASGIAGGETTVAERGTLPCAHFCAQER